MARLLNYYKSVLNLLLGWADNPIKEIMYILQSFISFDFQFNASWKYLFAPMWLYFFSSAAAVLSATKTILNIGGRISYWTVDVAGGLTIALLSSVAASIFSLNGLDEHPVLIISAGFVAFALIDVCWHALFVTPSGAIRSKKFLWFFLVYPLINFTIAVVLVWISLRIARSGYIIPAVVQILCIVVLMAVRNVAAAAFGATFRHMALKNLTVNVGIEGIPWRKRLTGFPTFTHARWVLIVVFAAVLFLLGSRGLEIVNLA